ncbi:hypothetical protein D1872_309930 [compost metagenome]
MHRPAELLQVHLEPVQTAVEAEVKFMALAPVVHQHTFFRGAFRYQQRAVIAGGRHVFFDLLGALIFIIDESPALM